MFCKNNLKKSFAEDYLWWLMILKKVKYCDVLRKNLTSLYIGKNNRSIHIFANFYSLAKIYKKTLKFNSLQIIFIFTLLFVRTFGKNIFKYKAFFKK